MLFYFCQLGCRGRQVLWMQSVSTWNLGSSGKELFFTLYEQYLSSRLSSLLCRSSCWRDPVWLLVKLHFIFSHSSLGPESSTSQRPKTVSQTQQNQ